MRSIQFWLVMRVYMGAESVAEWAADWMIRQGYKRNEFEKEIDDE